MEFANDNSRGRRQNGFTPRQPKNESLYDTGGRLQPRDTEIEAAVLGALMLEKDAYTTVCDLLKPESFYDPKNQSIYAAIQQLGAQQQPIDMLTVTEKLRANGDLEAVGGPV